MDQEKIKVAGLYRDRYIVFYRERILVIIYKIYGFFGKCLQVGYF